MPIAKTVANDLDDDLGALIEASTYYLSEMDPEVRAISRTLDNLAKVDAAKSSSLKIRYAALLGDREMGEYWARNAERLHAEKNDILVGLSVLYLNLGYYSECVGPMAQLTDPVGGIPTQIYKYPLGNGMFHLLAENHAKAKEMRVSNLPDLEEFISLSVAAMDAWNETDADYLSALDLAGEVMRRRRMFVSNQGFRNEVIVPVDGGLPYCKITFTVAVDLDTSIDMTCEYLEALSASQYKIPQSMSFEFESENEE